MPRQRWPRRQALVKRDPTIDIEDLPVRWQLVARNVLAKRERRLEQLSFTLNQARSAIDSRREAIDRLLGTDRPVAAFATTGEFREGGTRRRRSRAVAVRDDRSREEVLEEVVRDLRDESSRTPSLATVNRELREEGERRATQAELDYALDTLRREEEDEDGRRGRGRAERGRAERGQAEADEDEDGRRGRGDRGRAERGRAEAEEDGDEDEDGRRGRGDRGRAERGRAEAEEDGDEDEDGRRGRGRGDRGRDEEEAEDAEEAPAERSRASGSRTSAGRPRRRAGSTNE
jgi:hypothetical protein